MINNLNLAILLQMVGFGLLELRTLHLDQFWIEMTDEYFVVIWDNQKRYLTKTVATVLAQKDK